VFEGDVLVVARRGVETGLCPVLRVGGEREEKKESEEVQS